MAIKRVKVLFLVLLFGFALIIGIWSWGSNDVITFEGTGLDRRTTAVWVPGTFEQFLGGFLVGLIPFGLAVHVWEGSSRRR